jgi:hypothetical protein
VGSRRVVAAALAIAAVAGAAGAQRPERAPKTAAELQRQSGHVWDLAMGSRLDTLRPLRTKAYRRALDDFRAGKTDLRRDLDVSWGEFVSGTGRPFLALALDRQGDADLPAGRKVTIFGEILDQGGKAVASFEVDDEPEISAGRAIVDLALPLDGDGVRALVGIAMGSEVRWLVEQPLELRPIDRQSFSLSRPVLSLDVRPLTAPQRPDDPFCFGGLRVAPRGDRTFRGSDEPWLFVVVRAPQLGEGAAPRLAAELRIERADGGLRRKFPVHAPTATPLRGFDGQWGLGIPLPVGGLPPGDYRASLQVTEKAGASATAVTDFTVAAAPPTSQPAS